MRGAGHIVAAPAQLVISFASIYFYIYFIIVLSNTIIFVCISFYAINIESKSI